MLMIKQSVKTVRIIGKLLIVFALLAIQSSSISQVGCPRFYAKSYKHLNAGKKKGWTRVKERACVAARRWR
jgi:hypothetical protein